MERRSGRTTAGAGDPGILERGTGLVDLWQAIAQLFLWLCMLIPVALFLLFLPLLAGMLSTGQMTARLPAGVASVDLSGTAPAPALR